MYISSKILSNKNEEMVNIIITQYLSKIECNPYSENLDCISNIYVISEVFSSLDDKKRWLDILACILKKLGSQFLSKYTSLSSFNGVTAICHALSNLTKKSGTFFSVKEQFDKILLETTNQYIEYCNSEKSISVAHYDVVSGLSGALNYIADFDYLEAKETVEKIIAFFGQCSSEYENNNVFVPKWHIRPELLFHYGKESFPEGNMDFGLAHGIAGPMMALSKTYKNNKDIRIPAIIEQLIALYWEYKYIYNGIAYWPAHLSLNSYRDHKVARNEVVFAPSWCYGNWSESLALKNAAESVGNHSIMKFATNNLRLCYCQDFKYSEPVICHGYGGNIVMLTKLFSNDAAFREKINCLTQNVLQFYDTQDANLFLGLEDSDSILTGCGGVVLALICALKGSSCLYDVLMLNCGCDDAK